MSRPTDPHQQLPASVGPLLYARGADARQCRLAAVLVLGEGEEPPGLEPDGGEAAAPVMLARMCGRAVWRYDFALPARSDAGYRLGGERYPVAADMTGDLRVAFVSCNGQEHGDDARELGERDVMWLRLGREHASAPFALLLHGGDQLYADEVLQSHPDIDRWEKLPRSDRSAVAFTAAMREAARSYYFSHYLRQMAQPAIAAIMARVPSLMMWDDHDIMDGWGSHPAPVQDSAVGQGVFAAAREMFALFQLGSTTDDPPALCPDRNGRTFTLHAQFPRLSVLAPDLRSERRPNRIMGTAGWSAFEATLAASPPDGQRLLMSTVPALGPRLSWLQAALDWFPGGQQYEDDLRDQWQSRSHREEWARFLTRLEHEIVERRAPVTVLSGEIHLATRGEMTLGTGAVLHQLVASGIAHPAPPRGYAHALGTLARFGGAPLPGRRIALRPLPGHADIYTAERNYLVLQRSSDVWTAEWELETGGRTAPVFL